MTEPPNPNPEVQKTQIDRTAYQFSWRYFPLGAQILCIAFGALVLVPILTGLNPNVALLTAGLGTLVFQWVTGGKVPVFLASSFAFIAPIQLGVEKYGLAETLSGLMAAGIVYLLLSILIVWRGSGFLLRLLPPVVTGPVIMVIGLSLAPIAIGMASNAGEGYSEGAALAVSGSALLATLLTVLFSRGWLKLVPILVGLLVGYLVAFPFGMVDLTAIAQAPWFALPQCTLPKFHLPSILFIVPVAIAPAIEHFGDILTISAVAQKDYLRDPGIHRTLLGDGLATSLAACFGGPPNTTYSEVTGAVALIKIFNAGIMTWAAILAILLAFVGKLGAFLRSIPVPAMGGILVILFGTIIVVGMNSLVRSGEDLIKPRNLIIVAIILVFGVGGLSLKAGEFALEGIGLAGIFGVLLNWLLPESPEHSS
ncbi:uracil-xanthine permease family protein [Roseofilum capinflatum]|uniref:Uracil-xanthine permease family protein n=1 Tax=Roseofilum capinflatum BLCC-M114 TaxID=3022440 RepID=A0ABT7BAP8_9CYAN|nr:uracil-xanthine permease family protein [Roseofilum capinflatum]MDJ1176221.1 uracil-xanthine permease family protein [Roseofilum capinflatum BLCC-M114]